MFFFMTSEEYYDGFYSLVPMVIATFINFMYLFAVNQEYFYKKTKTIAIGTIIATITGIILNYALIPVLGYIIAAYVSCASNMVLFVIHTGIVKHWGKPSVVSIRHLFSLLLLASGIGAFTICLRETYVPRYLMLILICSVLGYYTANYMKLRKQQKDITI